MFSKEYVINTIIQEHEIIKHLVGKITTQEQLAYAPNASQRTLGELLTYIALMSSNFIKIIQEEKMRPEIFAEDQQKISSDILENFNAYMDTQKDAVVEYITNTSTEDLDHSFDAFGMGQSMAVRDYLMFVLRQYPAYRMQLFQYLKSGLEIESLHTLNLWMGQDLPQK